MKRGDENELERKLRLEKKVATEQLRLAMETDEKKKSKTGQQVSQLIRLSTETNDKREARLDRMSANQHIRLPTETNNKREARLDRMSANQHLRLAAETNSESSKTGTSVS